MDVTLRNELTRPYKIPRKRADDQNDGAETKSPMKSRSLVKDGQEGYRSPVLSASQRPQPSTSRKTNVSRPSANLTNALSVGMKRNSPSLETRVRPSATQVKSVPNTKSTSEKRKTPISAKATQPATSTLDIIMNEMKSLEKDTKKKKKAIQPDSPAGTDENSPSTSKQISTSHFTSAYAPLTRLELMRNENDNALVYNFLQKETGIMEVILGYKLLNGKIEPYAFEHYGPLWNSGNRNRRSSTSKNKAGSDAVPSPAIEATRKGGPGPRTPPGPGPRTPTGTPGSDSNNSVRSSSPRSCAKRKSLTPPPLPPPILNSTYDTEQVGKAELLKEMSQLTKMPMNQLEANLGIELKDAMDRVDRSTLFNTLKDALRNMGQKSDEQHSRNEERKEPEGSTCAKGTNEACEAMSISSDQSGDESRWLCPPPPPPLSPPPLPPAIRPSSPRVPTPPSPSSRSPNDFMPPQVDQTTNAEQFPAPRFDVFQPTFVTSIASNTMPTAIMPTAIIIMPTDINQTGTSTIPVSATTLIAPCPPPPNFTPHGMPLVQSLPNVPPPSFGSQLFSSMPPLSSGESWKVRDSGKPKDEPTIMDLIRSRPPPVIPEMLKKNMLQSAGMPDPTPSVAINVFDQPPPPTMPLPQPDFSIPPPSLGQPVGLPPNAPNSLMKMNVPPPMMAPLNGSLSEQQRVKFQLGAHCAAGSAEKVPSTSRQAAAYVPSDSTAQPMDISPQKPNVPSMKFAHEGNIVLDKLDMSVPPPSVSKLPAPPETTVFKTLMSALSRSGPSAQNPINPDLQALKNPVEASHNQKSSTDPNSEHANNPNSSWADPSTSHTKKNIPPLHNSFLYDSEPRFDPPNRPQPTPLFHKIIQPPPHIIKGKWKRRHPT